MSKIVWTEQYSIGDPLLDQQHRLIIEMLNLLTEFSIAKIDPETISQLLSDMTHYSQMHFKTEESYLSKRGYPYLKEHKENHVQFILKTERFCEAAMINLTNLPDHMLAYLSSWWRHHILEEDMKYKSYFDQQVNKKSKVN